MEPAQVVVTIRSYLPAALLADLPPRPVIIIAGFVAVGVDDFDEDGALAVANL